MTRLILWRHGQTVFNAEQRIQGQADAELDATGLAQARIAASVLVGYAPDAIVVSDLRRVTATVAPLAAATGLPVHTDPRLRERHFGAWQGLLLSEVRERYPDEHARWRAGANPIGCGIEDVGDMAERVALALGEIAGRYPDSTVVVGCHGASIRYGMAPLLGWTVADVRAMAVLTNCHWAELRHRPSRGWVLHAYNVGPLETAPRATAERHDHRHPPASPDTIRTA